MSVHTSVVLELPFEAFQEKPIPYRFLDWVQTRYHIDGSPLYATYQLKKRRLDTVGFDMKRGKFATLERPWSKAPFVTQSEDPRYLGGGYRRTHRLRRPRLGELLEELALNAPPGAQLTARYVGVPERVPLPEGAFVWPPARTNK